MAHPKHEFVRERYRYHCGYCGVSEVDTGGELTVDHYTPLSAGGDESDDNLVYACFRCNLFKSDIPPDSHATPQNRLLHPLHDDLTAHIREDEQTGLLHALTPTGDFHIFTLHLNRTALVNFRLRRTLHSTIDARLDIVEQENRNLHDELRERSQYIASLEARLGKNEDET